MELKAQTRTVLGRKVRALRREGLVPAELYGHNVANQHLSVPVKEFSKVYREAGEHTVVNLVTEDGARTPVIIAEVAHAPLTGNPIAIDFHQVRMDEKLQAKVPIAFIGEAPAMKLGFLIVKVLDEIPIEALPANIPHRIEVNLSSLEHLGQSIHLAEIAMPKDVKVLAPGETVIATVTERAKEEVAPAPAAPPAGEETANTVAPPAEATAKPNPAASL